MAHITHALTRFVVDHSAMSPRYRPGDELFLRTFFGVPCPATDNPDIVITTNDGRIHIGQFVSHDANGVSILLLYHNQIAFIAHNRQPILYAIAGVKRQKCRPLTKNQRTFA